MTIKQLRAFLAVAQSLSFAQACERLHLSQPALSLAIKTLEESLGGQLLVRTTRSVALTPEGETLLPIARRLLADWDDAEELLHQHFTLQLGKVAIAAMPSFASNLLPVALKAFRDRHPKVNVAVHDVINEQVLEMVRSHRVELGIAFEPSSLEGLAFTPFYSDRFVAVVPAGCALAERDTVSWAELLGEPFITLQRPRPCACCWKTASPPATATCPSPSKATNWSPSAAWSPRAWASAPSPACASSRWKNWAPAASPSTPRKWNAALACCASPATSSPPPPRPWPTCCCTCAIGSTS